MPVAVHSKVVGMPSFTVTTVSRGGSVIVGATEREHANIYK